MLVVNLNQTDAAFALGVSVNKFISQKKAKFNMLIQNKKKLYQIPLNQIEEYKRKQYLPNAYDDQQVELNSSTEFLEDVLDSVDSSSVLPASLDDLQVEKMKIDIEWKKSQILLNQQKNEKQKQLMFDEWSEKFFTLFAKNFSALKNEIIALRLTEGQNDKLKKLIRTLFNQFRGRYNFRRYIQ